MRLLRTLFRIHADRATPLSALRAEARPRSGAPQAVRALDRWDQLDPALLAQFRRGGGHVG